MKIVPTIAANMAKWNRSALLPFDLEIAPIGASQRCQTSGLQHAHTSPANKVQKKSSRRIVPIKNEPENASAANIRDLSSRPQPHMIRHRYDEINPENPISISFSPFTYQ